MYFCDVVFLQIPIQRDIIYYTLLPKFLCTTPINFMHFAGNFIHNVRKYFIAYTTECLI